MKQLSRLELVLQSVELTDFVLDGQMDSNETFLMETPENGHLLNSLTIVYTIDHSQNT